MLILASASPRRQELLHLVADDFVVKATNTDETLSAGITPEEAVKTLALRKARAAMGTAGNTDIVIGSDTVVVLDGEILGKPQNRDDAAAMLRKLSARTHRVYTGAALVRGNVEKVFASCADVTFDTLTEREITEYLDTNEPFDKAGAYGIQGFGARYITGISGDYYTVVGLPVHLIYKALRDMQ